MAELTPDEAADAARMAALARLLSPGSVVFDVGANRGQFATRLLEIVPCTVVSFEPGEEAFADLTELTATRPSIEPVRAAITDVTGPVEFFVSASDLGSSLLEPVPGQTSQWATLAGRATVDGLRLDDFMTARGIDRIDLLKTDCQGADAQALRSAGRFLSPDHIGALLVELNFHQFYRGQEPLAAVFEIAYEAGYFLAGFYQHVNREGWLWWADALFLPNRAPFSTQFPT